LRFAVRVTATATAALLTAQFFTLPLHGLWVVLTAIVVTQLSVGGSVHASVEYFVGTLGGAVFAGLVGFAIPHTSVAAQIGVLALVIAPLGFAAAVSPQFRVAPFSAVLVLLISGQLGEGPIGSALTRMAEVALGGAIAVIVSLLIVPVRADRLVREAAAGVLNQMADHLPKILAGVFASPHLAELRAMQDSIGHKVAALQDAVEEVERERPISFTSVPDPAPLPRTLLRLRHDFIIMGRASAEPLPADLNAALKPILDRAGAVISGYFRGCARALTTHHSPLPPLEPVTAELDSCASQLTALQQRELRHLSVAQLEQLFALGFGLEQLQQNVTDLARCVRDWAISPR